MKTPKEFEQDLRKMFDTIWDCEIDDIFWDDTVGDLMRAVIQLYKNDYENNYYKLVEQQPCKDAISRADAIKCGLTDADTDKYAVQVQNGEGYYNSDGRYVSYDLD